MTRNDVDIPFEFADMPMPMTLSEHQQVVAVDDFVISRHAQRLARFVGVQTANPVGVARTIIG